MTYEHFLAVCNALGDQNLPEGERWRSISLMHIDNLPIFNFQDMYKAGNAYFVGDGTGPTGFVFHEHIPAELSVKGDPITSFVDLNVVFSVHFVMQEKFKTAADIVKAIDPTFAPTVTVAFEKDEYTVASAAELMYGKVFQILTTDPAANVTLGYFSTRELAEAASAPADSDMKLTDIGIGVTMYLRAFVDEPFTTSDVAIASLVPKECTYTFRDEDGTVLKTETAPYGTTIVPPANPTKEGNDQYSYTFKSWTGYTTNMQLSGNCEFVASYTSTVNKYTYTFYDEDGTTVLKTATVDYGTAITPPVDPAKESDNANTYTFSEWTGYTSGMTITEHVYFTATYTATAIMYKATFKNEDGSVYDTVTGEYGDTITLPTAPTKEADDTNTYEFDHWDGYTTGMTFSGDHEFTAVFTTTPIPVDPEPTPDEGGGEETPTE